MNHTHERLKSPGCHAMRSDLQPGKAESFWNTSDPEVVLASLLRLSNSELYPRTKQGFFCLSAGHATQGLGPAG